MPPFAAGTRGEHGGHQGAARLRCTTGIPRRAPHLSTPATPLPPPGTRPSLCCPTPCASAPVPVGLSYKGWDRAPCRCRALTPHTDTAEGCTDTAQGCSDTAENQIDIALRSQGAMGFEAVEGTTQEISSNVMTIKHHNSASSNQSNSAVISNSDSAGTSSSNDTTIDNSSSAGTSSAGTSSACTSNINDTSDSNRNTNGTSSTSAAGASTSSKRSEADEHEQARLSRTAFRAAEKRFKLVKEDRDAPRHRRKHLRQRWQEQHKAELRFHALPSSLCSSLLYHTLLYSALFFYSTLLYFILLYFTLLYSIFRCCSDASGASATLVTLRRLQAMISCSDIC